MGVDSDVSNASSLRLCLHAPLLNGKRIQTPDPEELQHLQLLPVGCFYGLYSLQNMKLPQI